MTGDRLIEPSNNNPLTPARDRVSSLVLFIGIPGSGKSTLAQQLMTVRPGFVWISTDRIRAQLFGDEAIQGSWVQIWNEVQRQLRESLRQIHQGDAQGVLYDATNVVRRERRQVLASFRQIGFQHITGWWIDVPLSVCLQRNQQRDRQVPDDIIQRMHRRLMGAPPSLQEDIDCLIRYPNLGNGNYP